ncbi:MAG: hypothetical protein K0R57_1688 [Paenibacillaceae bacterium]|jgi:hypothetical protein|nr:hypothetical protein [Paenibacillaceae bacterium]
MITLLSGQYRVAAPWQEVTCTYTELDFAPGEEGGTVEIALESFAATWKERDYPLGFEECAVQGEADFQRWLMLTPTEHAGLPETRELAREIARLFCRLCGHGGMAENFHPLTGEGQRDRMYSWTASVFLIMAHEYV